MMTRTVLRQQLTSITLQNNNLIRELSFYPEATLNNFIDTNQVPVPSSNAAALALLVAVLQGYCTLQAVGASAQVLGSITAPTFTLAFEPAQCPILEDPDTAKRYVSWEDCDPAALVLRTTPWVFNLPFVTGTSFTAGFCRYEYFLGTDQTWSLGGGNAGFTLRRSTRGFQILPIINQINLIARFTPYFFAQNPYNYQPSTPLFGVGSDAYDFSYNIPGGIGTVGTGAGAGAGGSVGTGAGTGATGSGAAGGGTGSGGTTGTGAAGGTPGTALRSGLQQGGAGGVELAGNSGRSGAAVAGGSAGTTGAGDTGGGSIPAALAAQQSFGQSDDGNGLNSMFAHDNSAFDPSVTPWRTSGVGNVDNGKQAAAGSAAFMPAGDGGRNFASGGAVAQAIPRSNSKPQQPGKAGRGGPSTSLFGAGQGAEAPGLGQEQAGLVSYTEMIKAMAKQSVPE